MSKSLMRHTLLSFLVFLLVGCASDMTVKLSPTQSLQKPGDLLALVVVNDLRPPGIASSKREAAFGVPMGNISFDPPETQLVKEILERGLTKLLRERGILSKQAYVCDIQGFGVNTSTTALYWDVIGRIQLVLKHNGREYNLTGGHTERTYVWPGESLVKKVVEESLRQVSEALGPVAQAN